MNDAVYRILSVNKPLLWIRFYSGLEYFFVVRFLVNLSLAQSY